MLGYLIKFSHTVEELSERKLGDRMSPGHLLFTGHSLEILLRKVPIPGQDASPPPLVKLSVADVCRLSSVLCYCCTLFFFFLNVQH